MFNIELKKMIDAAGEYISPKNGNRDNSLSMNVDLCWLDNSFINDTLKNQLKKIASMTVQHRLIME
jgi:hypothetical protein